MKMKKSLFVITFIAFLFAFAGSLFAATYTLDATDSGWYNPTYDPNNLNYIVGNLNGTEYRNFFVFNLSGISETITSATLEVECPTAFTPDGTEMWTLYDVSTPIATLVAGGTSSSIFNDLGSGTAYGSATVASGFVGNVTVTLNADAVAALNTAKGSSFALGGAITTLGGGYNEYVFSASGDFDDVRRLTLVTVDMPAISVTKTPPTQSVPSGQNATFTLTVTNTDNVALTTINVIDPQCDSLSGPVKTGGDQDDNLETGEVWTYTCTVNNVTSSFTNTVEVEGTPVTGGDSVSDTDSAQVIVQVPVVPQQVPTMTLGGMILFGFLTGLSSIYFLRKRRIGLKNNRLRKEF